MSSTRRLNVWLPLVLVTFSMPALAVAQGSKDDFDRSMNFQRTVRGKVYRDRVTPNWIDGGKQLWYEIKTGPDSREWVFVDGEKGERRAAFDHQKLAAVLADATKKEVDAKKLPLSSFAFTPDLKSITFYALDKHWRCDLDDYSLHASDDKKSEPELKTTVTVLPRPRPSQGDGPQTTIKFVNHTAGPVKLFWLDASGDRNSYGTIEANKDQEQSTHVGHVWLVTDNADRPLGTFEAIEKGGVAVVDGSSAFAGPGRGPRAAAFRGRGGPPNGRPASPDGNWRASIKDHNLVVRNLKTDEQITLTTTGTADDPFVERFYWSPDSSHLVGIQEKVGDNRQVNFVESSPRTQVQPILHTIHYDKPGDKLPVARPRLFDIGAKKQVPVSEDLFPNAWSVTDFHWQPNSRKFMFLYNQRGHQVLRVVAVDAETGEANPLIDEQSKTFIDYSGKSFLSYFDKTNEIIWMSERDGWCHLYLYDWEKGGLKNQITRGPWVVRGLDRIDEDQRQIWFHAGGLRGEQDPYYVHYGRVNFDGSGFVMLTAGDGNHEIDFSPDRKFILDTYSRVDMPPVTELRRVDDGTLACTLEHADWSDLLATGWKAPERFVSKARDGETDIYGIICRPSNFDPDKKYPVIEKIYAGPQGAFVPKPFTPTYEGQALAELGFIVVQMDGMGTSYRSKKFHDVCFKNLGDSGFPDRILWMKAAAEKYPQLDLSRVGVYGTSAGGQSALGALLTHGEFYKVGIADSGCHDNRMDKVWWNEQWMGWPIGPHYAEQSNVTQAKNLKGKLMLVVGEVDTNVDPASTMQVVNALIKADKDFDLIFVPGANHGVGASNPYCVRRGREFFVKNLLGKEPHWSSSATAANELPDDDNLEATSLDDDDGF